MKCTLAFGILSAVATGLGIAAVHVQEIPVVSGTIGLGTWNTQAEFKDIEVTVGDNVLYRSDFTNEAKGWQPSGGDWQVVGGAYRQGATGENRRSILKLPALAEATDYTVRLMARKIAETEGFLILFHVTDQDFYWLNLGGWLNRSHGVEHKRVLVGRPVPGRSETGRWYEIRIELTGRRIKCFLDGARIGDVSD
jgi:hypothetical protein